VWRHKWKLLALAGLVLLAGVTALVLWPPPSSRVTRENSDRIKQGMTQAEVEAILGPPGDYTTGPMLVDLGGGYEPVNDAYPGLDRNLGSGMSVWRSDAGCVVVAYSVSGEVLFSQSVEGKRRAQGPLDNLLWRAKRQWRKWFPTN
jgi:hypothetical protein